MKIADPANSTIKPHQVLHNQYHELHSHGEGNSRRQVQIISLEQLRQTALIK